MREQSHFSSGENFNSRYITPRYLAQKTGINYALIRRMIDRGDIPSIPFGAKRRRVDAQWVDSWLSAGLSRSQEQQHAA